MSFTNNLNDIKSSLNDLYHKFRHQQENHKILECIEALNVIISQLNGQLNNTSKVKNSICLEAIPYSKQLFYYYNETNEVIEWFGAIKEVTGYEVNEFSVFSVDDFLKIVHSDDRNHLILLRSEAREENEEYEIHYRIKKKQGEYIDILDRGRFATLPDGNKIMLGAISEITALKSAEKLLEARKRTSKLVKEIIKVSALCATVDDMVKKSMELISNYAGWPLAHTILLYNIKYNVKITPSFIYSIHTERYQKIIDVFNDGASLYLSPMHIQVVENKKALWFNNIYKNKEYKFHNLLEEAGLRHLIIIPLLVANEVVGLIEFYATHFEISDELMPEFLEEVGIQLGLLFEHKSSDEELRKLRMAIDQNFASIQITDYQGIIEYVNPKFCEITGYSIQEVLGKKPNIIKSGIHPKEFYKHLWQTISTGKQWFGEICNKRKDGSLFWEEVSISPVKNAKGEITHYVAVKIDVTQKRQYEEELKKAKEEAEAASKAKSEFLANMSHEIRTPMNAILGFTEVLLQKTTDEQAKSYLDSIKSSGKNLLTLINDVLDLSKIEAGKMKINKDFIDPFMMFKDIEYLFSLRAAEKGLDFKIITDLNLPIGIEIDEVRLRQILINLIGNAIKFTEKGRVIVNVSAFPSDNDKIDLKIVVEDTGIGIDPEFQKKIFEPFTQQEGASTKRFGGTGLGLSITKRLVDLLEGEISLESEVNKGSKFTVLFKQIRCTGRKQLATDMVSIDPKRIQFYPGLVLIADDVENNRKYLKTVIQDTNLEIIETTNGIETFELAKARRPQLIITDLKMPGLNGFELLSKLRNEPKTKYIPVIATTATASIEEQDKLLVHKFDGILIKPIQINDVYIELMRFLPHEIIEEENVEENKEISIEAKSDSETRTVKMILESELYDIWQNFEQQQPMNEVEDFAYKIRDLGKKYNLEILISYGNRLIAAVNNFDVDNIQKILADYPKLLRTFKVVTEE